VRIDGADDDQDAGAKFLVCSPGNQVHGSVLWVRLDEDEHRMGFVLTLAVKARYPNDPNEAHAIKEAMKEAVEEAITDFSPFTLRSIA